MLAGCSGACPALLQPLQARCLQAGKGWRRELLEWFCTCRAQPPLAHQCYVRPGVLPVRLLTVTLNAQRGGTWLKLEQNLARVHWGNLFKNQPVCSAAASLTNIWAGCCYLMLEHTGWGKSQLCLFVHKQLSSVPCLGQNGIWGCQHEKRLAWVKIAESSCCSYTDTVTNNVCVSLAHMALSLIYFLIMCTLP